MTYAVSKSPAPHKNVILFNYLLITAEKNNHMNNTLVLFIKCLHTRAD